MRQEGLSRLLGRAALVVAVASSFVGCGPAAPIADDPGARGAVDLSRFIPELRDMALIPGGVAQVGVPAPSPAASVSLGDTPLSVAMDETDVVTVGPFFMDRFEVTQAEYAGFLDASGYRPEHPSALLDWQDGRPTVEDEHKPVVFVSLGDARAYAAYYGKRLPTYAEWAIATRGPADRNFPWGRSFNRNRLNCLETGIGTAWRVGTFESGKSPQGCYDLFGNVWEWIEARLGDSIVPLIAGGSFLRAMEPEESKDVVSVTAGELSNDVGFRCVRDVSPEIYGRYLDLLHSEWPSVRLRVLADLELLDRERSIQTLKRVQVGDPDPGVRIIAARRLIALGQGHEIDVEALVDIVAPGEPLEVRIEAMTCLNLLLALLEEGDLRPAADPLFAILERLPTETVMFAPPEDTAASGRESRRPVMLFRLLTRLLVEMKQGRVFSFLTEVAILADQEELSVASAEALGHFNFVEGFNHTRVLTELYRIVRESPREAVRDAAFDSLCGFDPEDSMTFLVRILGDPAVADIHRAAAEELSRYETEESIRALGAALLDPDQRAGTRVAAAGSLLDMRYVDVDEGRYVESLMRLGFGYLDRGMPALFELMRERDPELALDQAAVIVNDYIEVVARPELFAATWLEYHRAAQRLPEGIREGVLAVLSVYGYEREMEDLADGTVESKPWVEIQPFLVRAQAISLLAEKLGIPRSEWEESDGRRTRKRNAYAEEIERDLEIATFRGTIDRERLAADSLLAWFRGDMAAGSADEDGLPDAEIPEFVRVRDAMPEWAREPR